jgi:hypothetical protein
MVIIYAMFDILPPIFSLIIFIILKHFQYKNKISWVIVVFITLGIQFIFISSIIIINKKSEIRIMNEIINNDDFHFNVDDGVLYNYDSLSEENKKIADAYLGSGASHFAPLVFGIYYIIIFFILSLVSTIMDIIKKLSK